MAGDVAPRPPTYAPSSNGCGWPKAALSRPAGCQAGLLARSPVMLPIPGTSSVEHLEQNWDARRIALSPDEVAAIVYT